LPLDDADVVLLIGRKNWGGKSGDEDRHQLLPILHRRRCRSLRGRRPIVTRSARSTAVAAGLGYLLLLGIVPFFAAPIAGVQNSGLYAPRRTPLARSPPRKRPSFAPAERPDASSLQTAAVAMRPSMALHPETPLRPDSLSLSLILSPAWRQRSTLQGDLCPRGTAGRMGWSPVQDPLVASSLRLSFCCPRCAL